MSGTNTDIVAGETPEVEENLDAFNDLFHKSASGATKEEVKEVKEEAEDAQPVIEEDADLANTEDDEDAEPELPLEEEEPKPKKNRTQERIEQLLQKEREANERANALEARLKQLEEKEAPKADPTPNKQVEENNDSSTYRDWETDRKSTRLNSSHSAKSRMPSSA